MYKIAIVADLHHFSKQLQDGGKAFHLRESAAQTCLAESDEIIDAAFAQLAAGDCGSVLIAGDMSNDGEKVCHEEVRAKMQKLAQSKDVYSIFSTHDWCSDGRARRFVGDEAIWDVETMTVPELRDFYFDFGEKQAHSTYVNKLGAASYAVKLCEDVRLIALNDDYSGTGKAGYTDEHFEWILNQIKEGKANGEAVIMMEHHLLLSHISKLINGGQMIGEWESRAEALADAGLDFVIVGHSHMQRTTAYTSKNGNTFHQINVGALCGHPGAVTILTIDENEFRIDLQKVQNFTYNGKEYTYEYITEHTKNLLMGILNAAVNDKQEFLDRFNSIDEKLNLDGKYYPLIKAGVKFLLKCTVGRAGRIVNFLTFGKGVNRKAVKQIKKENLVGHIMDIFLGVFDGSAKHYPVDSPVYIIVKDVASLPKRVSKVLPVKALKKEKIQKLFCDIQNIAEELTNPKVPNNQNCVIKRN